MKELAGTISGEEQSYLNQVVSENADAEALRKHLYNKLRTSEVNEAVEDLQNYFSLEVVKEKVERKRRSSILRLRYAAVVTVLLVISASLYLVVWKPSKTENSIVRAQPDTTGVHLNLSDGQVINLSGDQSQVKAGNITLNNTNKTLTYSTSASGSAKGWATLNIPVGKDYKIRLADGTEIQLNSASSLRFPLTFSSSSREITINGEAYLKVAPNASKPFIVHLPGSTVQVLGTEFNINTYDSAEVRVSLVQGSVKVKTPGNNSLLKPGFEVVYGKQNETRIRSFDNDNAFSWRTGIQEFKGASLEEVFQVVLRWYGVQVIASDNTPLNKRRFTGILDRNKSVETFFEGLKFTHDIDYTMQGDKIYIDNH